MFWISIQKWTIVFFKEVSSWESITMVKTKLCLFCNVLFSIRIPLLEKIWLDASNFGQSLQSNLLELPRMSRKNLLIFLLIFNRKLLINPWFFYNKLLNLEIWIWQPWYSVITRWLLFVLKSLLIIKNYHEAALVDV